MRKQWAALAATTAILACLPSAALGHDGNPNFESRLRGLDRPAPGVEVEVLNYDDSLQLTNHSGETVVIEGYEGEPYARLLPDGTVETNANSPATYLNDDRFAAAEVPERADPAAAPSWQPAGDGGEFSWHDHRIHWMAKTTPPAVDDESERTEIFDYRVPIAVGGEPNSIDGTLYWVGPADTSKAPFLIAGAAILVLGLGLVLIVRGRRGGQDNDEPDSGEPEEAW